VKKKKKPSYYTVKVEFVGNLADLVHDKVGNLESMSRAEIKEMVAESFLINAEEITDVDESEITIGYE